MPFQMGRNWGDGSMERPYVVCHIGSATMVSSMRLSPWGIRLGWQSELLRWQVFKEAVDI